MGFQNVEKIVLIFVDGLGVGPDDPQRNPMARVRGPILSRFSDKIHDPLPFDGICKPLDACLGIDGLPQSATGQTALLTGVNAAKLLNLHLFGFPNKKLQEVIMEQSLLKRAREAGRKPAFINAFRPRFFEMGDAVWTTLRLSVTTWVNHAAGLPFSSLDDVKARQAIYQDFTNSELIAQGFDLPRFTPEEAGEVLARRSRDFDLLLYEYFRTDAAGHSRDMEVASEEIRGLERFLNAFLTAVDLSRTLVVLSSDHGNIEDLSVRGHTRNPALTLLFGPDAQKASGAMDTIMDLPRVLLEVLV
ncbi:MAG: peptidase [Planctomycetota bacterium]